jgi:UDP-N-acetylglucosamine 2-epimerase (non-hydrolysing)
MIKALSVFGTRPEAIKMAPVIKELAKYPDRIINRVCVTAQHREMLDQVLSLFKIVPDHDLNLMQASQSPTQVASLVLAQLEPILQTERPDWVLVQGDTTTVMAASIAAFYARVKVGHIEAGLRTFDKWQPFPEEINRKIAGVTADLHFAPTRQSRQNLLREGVPDQAIVVTGNPVIDALHWVVEQPFDFNSLNLDLPPDRKLILVTAHRRENFGQPIEDICLALKMIAERHQKDVEIVYPVHLNPNIQEPVRHLLTDIPNITLLPALDYLPFAHLMRRAYMVLTDSGGIQEEAPGLGKPVLVLRNVTERPEAVEAGTVRLVGTDSATIVKQAERLLTDPAEYARMAQAVNPYGDGLAARRIVKALLE